MTDGGRDGYENDDPQPTFTSDWIDVRWREMEVRVWNRLTVQKDHELAHGLLETHHTVLAGDGSTGEKPEFITPKMADKLHTVDVYPDARIIDPTDEEVEIL